MTAAIIVLRRGVIARFLLQRRVGCFVRASLYIAMKLYDINLVLIELTSALHNAANVCSASEVAFQAERCRLSSDFFYEAEQ